MRMMSFLFILIIIIASWMFLLYLNILIRK
nr:MAG TPA: protein of unknown function (DUF4834) [Caudoviricetes sp.]